MAFNLAIKPRVIFKTNPLKVVVAQVRFPAIYALDTAGGVAGVQRALKGVYPAPRERGNQVGFLVTPVGVTSTPPSPGPWQFADPDGEWVVSIAQDFVALETTNYVRYEGFAERLRSLLQIVGDELGVEQVTREGLRYVNQLTHPDATTAADWSRLLAPQLLGLLADGPIGSAVVQSLQQMLLADESQSMAVRHGYARGEDDQGSTYIIDLDVYREGLQTFDLDDTMNTFGEFKETVWNFFAATLTEPMIAHLAVSETL